MEQDKKLVNHLKKIRRDKSDFTQEDLAEMVGCTRQTIIALEQNKYNPSLILALSIAEVLGVGVEDIFRLDRVNDD